MGVQSYPALGVLVTALLQFKKEPKDLEDG
jgi:hypothetical protein